MLFYFKIMIISIQSLKVETIETNESFGNLPTVVGFFPNIVEGDVYTFKGQVVEHPRYGKQ